MWPDATELFIECLKRTYQRIKELPKSQKGITFLWLNGEQIDFMGTANRGATPDRPSCPTGHCENTLWLGRICVHDSVLNNILYGFVAYLVGVSFEIAKLGADIRDLLKKGKFDPPRAKAAYRIGNVLAQRAEETDGYLERQDIVNAMEMFEDAYKLINDQPDCKPCPYPDVKCIAPGDFSVDSWSLGAGETAEWDHQNNKQRINIPEVKPLGGRLGPFPKHH